MSDERLRTMEQAFRASGDPVDLGRWLIEAQRAGLAVDRAPLELAANCGSEAAAFALGSGRVPGQVVCFRSLCRALRSVRNEVARPARVFLAATLARGLEVDTQAQHDARRLVELQLLGWTQPKADERERQARCMGIIPQLAKETPASRVFVRAYTRALNVLSPNTRASCWALENLLSLVSSGWIFGTRDMIEADKEARQATLRAARGTVEVWAFARVSEGLGARPATSPTESPSRGATESVARRGGSTPPLRCESGPPRTTRRPLPRS